MRIWIFCLVFLLSLAQGRFFTEKKIWVYWHEELSEARPFYRISFEKIRTICEKQNWNLTLVTSVNLHQHINNYSEFQQTVKNRKLTSIQGIGDYVKLLLIGDNGGVYLDMTSVMLYGFNWLLDLSKEPQMITNHVKGVEPEVIMFYTTITQHRTEYFYPGEGLKNFLPGFSLYFLAGKKGSQTIKLIKESFVSLYKKTFEEGVQKMIENDIYFRNLDHNYYLTIDKAMGYVIQKTQQKLDDGLSLISQRRNANQELKIWGLHSQDGPFFMSFLYINRNYDYNLTLQELSPLVVPRYFVKFTGGGKDYEPIFKQIGQIFGKYQSLEDYIMSLPSKQECLTKQFIVKDSIIGYLIESNKQAEKLNIFTITTQQRTKWNNYCSKLTSQQTNFSEIQRSIIRQFVESYKTYEAQVSIFKHIQNKQMKYSERLFQVIKQNRIMFYLFILLDLVFFLVVKIILAIKKTIKIVKKCLVKSQSYEEKKAGRQMDKNGSFFSHLVLALYVPLPIILHLNVFMNGVIDRQEHILSVLIAFLLVRKFVLADKSRQTFFGLAVEQLQNLLKSFTYYAIAGTIIYSTQNREQLKMFQTIFLALVFPQIMRVAKEILKEKRHRSNILLGKMLRFLQTQTSNVLLILIGIFLNLPNVKFLRTEDGYLIRKLFPCISLPAAVFYGLVCYEIILLALECYKSKERKRHFIFLSQIVTKFAFSSILIAKCFWIHQNYLSWVITEQRIFLDIFMMFIFMIINFSNCHIFIIKSHLSTNDNSRLDQTELHKLQMSELTKINDFQQSQNVDENKGGVELPIGKNGRNQQNTGLQAEEQDINCRILMANMLLFYLIPTLMILFRWTYKQNSYDYRDFIPLEFLVIVFNCGVLMAWKQYLQNREEDRNI